MAAHTTLAEATPPRIASRVLNFERTCQAIALLLGAQCAFAGRNLPVGADGLAYLDVARAYVRHDWQTAINGYWGPLYVWLLAIEMRLLHPGIRSEFALARALNFALFAVAVYTFSRYWSALAEWSKRVSPGDASIPATSPFVWIVLGYMLFVASFVWSVDVVNPDILVAALVFAVAALLFKLHGGAHHSASAYAWLGLLLAIGYYAKAIFLYFALFILGAIVIHGFRARRLRGPLTTALVFVILVAPFVRILSRTVGHFTAGDSGRLNYAWFVNGPETKTWMKDAPGGAPIPFYPGGVALDSPRVFHLPSIAGVTYAPWYDASRFDVRSHPVLNLRDQLRQLAINLRYPREQLLGAGAALTVPWLILFWYAPGRSLRNLATTWFFTLPAAVVIGMYLLVHLVQRFVLGFSLVLWGAAWASIFIPPGLHLLARRAMLAGTLVFAAYTMPGLLHYVVSQRTESIGRDITVAEALPRYGIAPGNAVASIGDGQEAYWAHFADVSIVAEVWSIDLEGFWSAPPEAEQAALRAIAGSGAGSGADSGADSGAKAVVWRKESQQPCPAGWRALPGNSGCLILLR